MTNVFDNLYIDTYSVYYYICNILLLFLHDYGDSIIIIIIIIIIIFFLSLNKSHV